jgi:ATP-dependent RNA helicase DDX55/SPB4
VSFVRAYSKHEASYIFRVKDLDLIGISKSFGLLRLPKMPELKDKARDGWDDAEVDVSASFVSGEEEPTYFFFLARVQWDNYAYADKAQEVKRLAAGAAAATARADEKEKRSAERAEKKQQNSAWSNQVSRKEGKDKRREKKDRKKKWLKGQMSINEVAAGGDQNLKRARTPTTEADEGSGDEWDELAREERMAKKVRRGNVSQGAFDEQFADL